MRTIFLGLGGVALAATLGLASCGSGGGAAAPPSSAITIGATNFVTIPPTQQTVSAPTTDPLAQQPQQSYTIKSGDVPINVAKLYNVQLTDLFTVNGWTDKTWMAAWNIGKQIIIPAGGTLPGATVAPTTVAGATVDTSGGATAGGATGATSAPTLASVAPATTVKGSATTTTLKGGNSNCAPGSYVIVAGDYLGKVAAKFDTTVDALNAANANTKNYSAFYPGLKIVIPAKTTPDCK